MTDYGFAHDMLTQPHARDVCRSHYEIAGHDCCRLMGEWDGVKDTYVDCACAAANDPLNCADFEPPEPEPGAARGKF